MDKEKQIAYKISKESVDKIFPKKDIDILGYESPIQVIIGQIRTEYENGIYKAIQEQGVSVDKDELIKALQYDRNQYDKGYINGYNRKASDVAEEIFAEIDELLSPYGSYIKTIDIHEYIELKKKYTEVAQRTEVLNDQSGGLSDPEGDRAEARKNERQTDA